VGATGLEPISAGSSSANDFGKSTPAGRAKSGVLGAHSSLIAPDLAVVVDAWPRLPEATRRDILEIARTADGTAKRQAEPPQEGEAS